MAKSRLLYPYGPDAYQPVTHRRTGGERGVHGGLVPDVTAPVVAAGRGSRLDRLTRFTSKELLPLGDDLVLSHILAEIQTGVSLGSITAASFSG